MTTSTYLTRITRLLVLCAVVAGTAAAVAGAYDAGPMSYGERWQGVDQNYRSFEPSNIPTPQGLKADGLRWQGIAKVYADLGEPTVVPVSSGTAFDWGDWAIGLVAGFGFALVVAGGVLLASHRIARIGRTGATAAG